MPRTHRLITLADHICVGLFACIFSDVKSYILMMKTHVVKHNTNSVIISFPWCCYTMCLNLKSSHLLQSVSYSSSSWIHSLLASVWPRSLFYFLGHNQQIITQDFARNQAAPQASLQPPTTTFQNSTPVPTPVATRAKTSNRYSPESQSQSVHHQRPGARVSPENLSDKSRGR